MILSELKPCPFCGGKAIVFHCAGMCYVKCVPCQVEILRNTRDEAVNDWNRRAQPANEPLTLEQMRGMDGEPVYLVDTVNPVRSGWHLVSVNGEDSFLMDRQGWKIPFECIRNDRLAYRRPPERSEDE